jgi:hypothetical protein
MFTIQGSEHVFFNYFQLLRAFSGVRALFLIISLFMGKTGSEQSDDETIYRRK